MIEEIIENIEENWENPEDIEENIEIVSPEVAFSIEGKEITVEDAATAKGILDETDSLYLWMLFLEGRPPRISKERWENFILGLKIHLKKEGENK